VTGALVGFKQRVTYKLPIWMERATKGHHISVCFVFISIPRKRCWSVIANLFLSDPHGTRIWGWHSDLMLLGSTTEMSVSCGEGCPRARSKHMHDNVVEGRLFESHDKRWILCHTYQSSAHAASYSGTANSTTDISKLYSVSRDVGAKPSGACCAVHVDWKVVRFDTVI